VRWSGWEVLTRKQLSEESKEMALLTSSLLCKVCKVENLDGFLRSGFEFLGVVLIGMNILGSIEGKVNLFLVMGIWGYELGWNFSNTKYGVMSSLDDQPKHYLGDGYLEWLGKD